jgi:ATP/maltotriose-dependent transcriptional regulator MalT
VERLLTALLNELLARGSDEGDHVVLVLDDYHVITNEAIHAALRLLLEHRPPQLHLVLSTRADPPLPLARLRGRDALLELRAAELQFTPEESSTYLVESRGLPLSAEERTLLHARTEGWITGLQLAALSHALAAPAFEEAARLREQDSATCLAGSQRLALLEWLLLAPAALGLLQALVLMDLAQWEEASAGLQAVGQGMDLGEEAQEAQGRLFLGQVLGCWGGRLARLSGERPGALVEAEGDIRLFLEEGPPLLRLLREAQRQGLAPAYIAKPLRAASKRDRTASPLPAPQHSLLVEPLTARERDVLQLLLDGASNQEIACQLTLSVNTAKKHVLNICGKLNVQRRVQAIAKARMLQLP